MKDEIKIGDTVICIDDRPFGNGIAPPVVYKQKYKVLDIQIHECGNKVLDVGFKLSDYHEFIKCLNCDLHYAGKKIWWCGINRFNKVIEDENEDSNIVKEQRHLSIKLDTKQIIKKLELQKN